eukprot:CAMPEP_0197652224 /NCGR_PEP_ID=MMETSP1338-20131121/34315_1 /TAXON_ID=43686 ORGANISM="Pelagodinium beii, Strain RCC1491" /NCGR_SAMPLE_ID=MMETSP1338 /ASSEMBLY_ACC=CAM_ASM_000754 /LENGTH=309 /DNA_ID=CAMNT_0043227043 /DNA_START=92 /DNA_END=1021 /DNA_ORIENTATION=+
MKLCTVLFATLIFVLRASRPNYRKGLQDPEGEEPPHEVTTTTAATGSTKPQSDGGHNWWKGLSDIAKHVGKAASDAGKHVAAFSDNKFSELRQGKKPSSPTSMEPSPACNFAHKYHTGGGLNLMPMPFKSVVSNFDPLQEEVNLDVKLCDAKKHVNEAVHYRRELDNLLEEVCSDKFDIGEVKSCAEGGHEGQKCSEAKEGSKKKAGQTAEEDQQTDKNRAILQRCLDVKEHFTALERAVVAANNAATFSNPPKVPTADDYGATTQELEALQTDLDGQMQAVAKSAETEMEQDEASVKEQMEQVAAVTE